MSHGLVVPDLLLQKGAMNVDKALPYTHTQLCRPNFCTIETMLYNTTKSKHSHH